MLQTYRFYPQTQIHALIDSHVHITSNNNPGDGVIWLSLLRVWFSLFFSLVLFTRRGLGPEAGLNAGAKAPSATVTQLNHLQTSAFIEYYHLNFELNDVLVGFVLFGDTIMTITICYYLLFAFYVRNKISLHPASLVSLPVINRKMLLPEHHLL